jgi:hypothetical protein
LLACATVAGDCVAYKFVRRRVGTTDECELMQFLGNAAERGDGHPRDHG